MAQFAELVFFTKFWSTLDQPYLRTKYINFVFFNGFFHCNVFFDTYFDATAMTGNMQLFISAQRKIPTSYQGYFYPD